MDKTEGYFIIALGEKYVDYALKFIESKLCFDDKREICVLINPDDIKKLDGKVKYIISYNPDDFVKKYNLLYHHEIYGALPKIKVMDFSPFDKTIHVDADCFFIKSPQSMWDTFNSNNRHIGITGVCNEYNSGPESWHWGHLREVEKACEFKIPQVSGGIVYFDKTNLSDYNDIVDYYIINYDKYNIKRWFNYNSFDDEIFYAIYMGIKGIKPYNFDEFKIQQIPKKIVGGKESADLEYTIYHDLHKYG